MTASEPGSPWSEERAREALAHLQRAALEFIDAARAVLDVAEEVVREPGGVAAVVAETVGGVAEALSQVAPAFAERGRAAGGRPPPAGAGPDGQDDQDAQEGSHAGGPADDRRSSSRGGVEHIRIS
jgi:hypothetical protein